MGGWNCGQSGKGLPVFASGLLDWYNPHGMTVLPLFDAIANEGAGMAAGEASRPERLARGRRQAVLTLARN